MNVITAQKITNFQNTVRHLKIILLSFFSCLSSERQFGAFKVKISLNPLTTKKMTNLQSRPYRKNLAELPYDQKDDQFVK